jgi:CheY-like chemotaxis protein
MRSQFLSAIVADDHKGSRDIVADILWTAGMRDIRVASDGGEAFRLICARVPDFVILDLEMPHDGLTTLRQIRRGAGSPNKQLPVIMMTAYATRARIENLRDAGATEIVTKPLNRAKLMDRIESIFLRPRVFIESSEYVGPDRRRISLSTFAGPFRRASDKMRNIIEVDVA